jgi:CRISPR-associated protein TM1802 (cas_TM1802).
MVDSIPIKKDNLLREFLSMLKCIRYASCEARYDNAPHNLDDFTLVQTTLIQVGFIKLLYELGLMETVKVSSALSNSIDKDIVRFMEYTQLTDKQKALFLLGVLIAEIGRAQYKKGDHKKSILDKINFEGMPREKVMALANRIVQSLRNYNILVNNEGVYSEMMKLLTYVIKDLNDPVENTYYILAGYSYQTNKILIGGNQNERS